jgi:O-antigen/teichoic acid export membrane protein
MLARAPIYLFQAVSTSLLPHLTRLAYEHSAEGRQAFQISVRATVAFVIMASLALTAVMAAAGPHFMQLVFGHSFTYDRAGLLIISAGTGFYLVAATFGQAALAEGQARRASFCWAACAIGFVTWCLVPVGDAFRRIELGFAGSAALLCMALVLLMRQSHHRPVDVIRPGSVHEREARLAAAEEVT